MIGLSERITDYLVRKGEISKEEVKIYHYGFTVAIDTVVDMVVLFIIGILMKHLIATIIFILVFTTVRIYTGGYHARTRIACIGITGMSLIFNIVVSEFISKAGISFYYYIVVSVFSVLITYLKAPVKNENKILEDEEVIVYHRKSLMLVSFFVIIAGICLLLHRTESTFISTTLFEISLMMLVCKTRDVEF